MEFSKKKFELFKIRLQKCLSAKQFDKKEYDELQELKYSIMPKLYRYMPATQQNISQYLIKNKIKLSTADFYQDKKDSTCHVDKDFIVKYVENIQDSLENGNIIAIYNDEKESIVRNLNDIEISSPILKHHENDCEIYEKFVNVGQKCFTTSKNSQYHWMEYTNDKGFCVEYDFKHLDFNTHIVHNIFPVFYSNKPKFDIFEYEGNWLNLYYLTLSKEKKYENDNEWRLIQIIDDLYEYKDEIVLPKPDCVYFSKNIDKVTKEDIIKICKERNIKFEI